MTISLSFNPPVASILSDHAFFDGLYIKTDSINNPFRDRVLPILPEEQIFLCRQMRGLIERLRDQRGGGLNVLDIGTGSGVLAIFADRVLNSEGTSEPSTIRALDLSRRALAIAKMNCKTNRCRNVQLLPQQPYSSTSVDPNSQDLILVNPPFNPTHPEWAKRVAWHAGASDIGMAVFREWIRHIPFHLRSQGLLIGYQMSPVKDGQIVGMWELSKALGSESLVRYYRIFPEDYETRKFLSEQYRDYLNQLRYPGQEKLLEWIDATAQVAPRLAIVCYEAMKHGGCGQVLEITGEPEWHHNASWEDRIRFHRMIVNNVQEYEEELPLRSVVSNVPVSAIKNPDFHLYDKYWQMQKNGASESDLLRLKMDIVNTSILNIIGEYICESDILRDYAFVLVDTTPILPGSQGSLQIHQECSLWSGRQIYEQSSAESEEIIKQLGQEYQLTTVRLQRSRLAPFFHPWFVYPRDSNGWARGFCGRMKGKDPVKSVSEENNVDWALSDEYYSQYFNKIPRPTDREVENIFMKPHVVRNAAFSTARLVNLMRPRRVHNRRAGISNFISWADYVRKFKERLASREGVNPETDFRACQWVMHRNLHREASAVLGEDLFSITMSMPLQAGVAKIVDIDGLDERTELPQEYYGGIWIWAGRMGGEPHVIDLAPFRDLMRFALGMVASTYGKLLNEAFLVHGDVSRQRQFGHRNIDILESLFFQLNQQNLLDKMDTATLGSLLLLKSSVCRYRQRGHDHRLPFCGIKKGHMKTYAQIAAYFALFRAHRFDSDKKCMEYARGLIVDHEKPANKLLDDLGWTSYSIPQSAVDTMETESFGMMLIHCLGQALYHSLVFRVLRPSDYKAPKVHFRVKDNYLLVSVVNIGQAPQPGSEPSKDYWELKELAEYFGVTGVNGPGYIDNSRWSTEFKIRLIKKSSSGKGG